jgi:hypothetical protein
VTVPEAYKGPGMCTATQRTDPLTLNRTLWIDEADEHVLVSDELLAELSVRGWAGEGLFRIEAENGSVTYALRERSPYYPNTWRAERVTPWPAAEAGGDRD